MLTGESKHLRAFQCLEPFHFFFKVSIRRIEPDYLEAVQIKQPAEIVMLLLVLMLCSTVLESVCLDYIVYLRVQRVCQLLFTQVLFFKAHGPSSVKDVHIKFYI